MTRTTIRAAAAALVLVALATPARAQEGMGPLLHAPTFVFQPGAITSNVISAPSGATTTTDFNLRFLTVIPTATKYLSLVTGVGFTPAPKTNAPIFIYGGVIPLGFVNDFTRGMLSLSIDPLGIYGIKSTAANQRQYEHNFYLETAFTVNLGSMMFQSANPWSSTGVYVLFVQQMSGLPSGADTFNPLLLYGLSIPVAPWGK